VRLRPVSTLEDARRAHVAVQEQLFGGPVLDGDTAFRMHDTYGLPLDVIRIYARDRGWLVDEWGLRLSMYLAGQSVPKPELWQIPRRAEIESPASNTPEANQAWQQRVT
jgi:alanyl-tRNA synthetase